MTFLLALAVLLGPAYSLRFNIGPLSANLLMVWLGFLILIGGWLIKQKSGRENFLKSVRASRWLWPLGLFLLSGLISLFWPQSDVSKAGKFLVWYIEPIFVFLLAQQWFQDHPEAKNKVSAAMYILLAAMGLYSLLQYFTLIGLPAYYWGNGEEPKRALGFFGHPNFYALFSAPLLAFLLPRTAETLKTFTSKLSLWPVYCWLLGLLGLALSLSRAGWLGLFAALVVFVFWEAEPKIRRGVIAVAVLGLVLVGSVPSLRWRIMLPFYGEKSAVSRLSLWQTGVQAIKEAPVLGLGLEGFSRNWDRLNQDKNLTENHNFPHNIFLNFWVEGGLMGLIGFLSIAGVALSESYRLRKKSVWALGVGLFFICLLVQGQLDNPYFKNDLAIIFWLVLAFL
jgi:O-antigen ligase